MARGEIVRYMAEKCIEDPIQIREFDRLADSALQQISMIPNCATQVSAPL